MYHIEKFKDIYKLTFKVNSISECEQVICDAINDFKQKDLYQIIGNEIRILLNLTFVKKSFIGV